MKSMQNGQGFGNVKSSGYMADVPHNQTKPVRWNTVNHQNIWILLNQF